MATHHSIMSQPTVRILIGLTWIGSVTAAYFIGQSGSSTALTTGQPAAGQTQTSKQSASGSIRAGHGIEGYQETDPGEDAAQGTKSVADLITRARVEMAAGMNGFTNMRGMMR